MADVDVGWSQGRGRHLARLSAASTAVRVFPVPGAVQAGEVRSASVVDARTGPVDAPVKDAYRQAVSLVSATAKRIAVVGNGGGGKSTLARKVAVARGLPLHHVDQVQFLPGWIPVSEDVYAATLEEWASRDAWVIDGWGPWQTLERRIRCADIVVFVDLPLWQHFWLAAERQIAAATGNARVDPVKGCDDTLVTRRLFETIWKVDQTMTPRLRELVNSLTVPIVVRVQDASQLEHVT